MCGWPPSRKGFFHVLAHEVTCSHVCGLLTRHETAGPDGIRGSNSDHGLGVSLPHDGWQVSLDPSVDRHCHHAFSPSQVFLTSSGLAGQAATARGRKSSCRVITAQAMRAILLANATAASFFGLLSSSFARHGSFLACLPFSTAVAPFTSSRLRYPLPRLLMGPSLTLPPVPSWRGTRPREAAKSRPLSKCLGSVTIAAIALLRIGPKPGMVSRWRAVGLPRTRSLMSLSRASICFSRTDSTSLIVVRAARATAGTRMPNSAIRPRNEFLAIVRCLTSIWRALWATASACCSTVLIGTKRIDGRLTASQIAFASAASFLLRRTYGLAYAGGISRASCPSAVSSRAQ